MSDKNGKKKPKDDEEYVSFTSGDMGGVGFTKEDDVEARKMMKEIFEKVDKKHGKGKYRD